MYILDSDTLDCYVHHQGRFPTLERRILATPLDQLFISVISLEEAINGALAAQQSKPNSGACCSAQAGHSARRAEPAKAGFANQ